ncbi:hypothetical protein AVEN_149320-1, partial [Araneus ventricosus]
SSKFHPKPKDCCELLITAAQIISDLSSESLEENLELAPLLLPVRHENCYLQNVYGGRCRNKLS